MLASPYGLTDFPQTNGKGSGGVNNLLQLLSPNIPRTRAPTTSQHKQRHHPLDPLSVEEVSLVAEACRNHAANTGLPAQLRFNCIYLQVRLAVARFEGGRAFNGLDE